MNFLNWGAQGGEAVRCSAWLGGMVLLLVVLGLLVGVTGNGVGVPFSVVWRVSLRVFAVGLRIRAYWLFFLADALDFIGAAKNVCRLFSHFVGCLFHNRKGVKDVMPPNDKSSATAS